MATLVVTICTVVEQLNKVQLTGSIRKKPTKDLLDRGIAQDRRPQVYCSGRPSPRGGNRKSPHWRRRSGR